MPPAARASGTPAAPKPPPTPCGYVVGEEPCKRPSTHTLPAGAASNSDPIPLCDEHAGRYLGAATPISS
jgi:hypothetical protein